MANTIIAGNATNNGLAFSSDNTGILNILTGSGAGTNALTIDASQNVVATANLTVTGTVTATGGVSGGIRSGTAVAATSGTSIDFTSLPTGLKRITVMFNGVSTTGSSALQVQIGDSGGVENTLYVSNAGLVTGGYPGAAGVDATATAGFLLEYQAQAASDILNGHLVLTNVSGNIWVGSGILGSTSGAGRNIFLYTGTKTLSDVLDRVRITTVSGTPTFDAGSINILYE
jgi:hypothetical protein